VIYFHHQLATRTGGGRTLAQDDCRYFPNLGGSPLLCPDAPGQHEVCLSVLMAPIFSGPLPPAKLGYRFFSFSGSGKSSDALACHFHRVLRPRSRRSVCADDPATGQPRFFDDTTNTATHDVNGGDISPQTIAPAVPRKRTRQCRRRLHGNVGFRHAYDKARMGAHMQTRPITSG
jgi:hypothetical protein